MSLKIKMACLLTAASAAAALLTGCLNAVPPVDVSTGLNGMQQQMLTTRNIGSDLEVTYDEVWEGVLTTLQLNGFILKQADKSSGYIYGVWSNTYEAQGETTNGSFIFFTTPNPNWSAGIFTSKTTVFEQIDVSITLKSLSKYETLVRLNARFDCDGVPTAEGIFANRFFGLVRKEIFLHKYNGSIYESNAIAASTK